MKKLVLSPEDLAALGDFRSKNISVGALSVVFSRINQNDRISPQEKYYLKKILVDNINNAFLRGQGG
ncbi:MAG: hypothetical protein LBD99_04610 [Candidatus Margulisbacteria bacterium]|jgi:hypothetical protein|nr:hypothetical protein [Candidatus Margulisiibacteriota bacterium]